MCIFCTEKSQKYRKEDNNMKKFLALLLTAMMALGMFSFASASSLAGEYNKDTCSRERNLVYGS